MNAYNDLIEHLRDEEHTGAVNAIAARFEAIEGLPQEALRARFCAAAFLMAGQGVMRRLEGDAATIRQLRRIADMIEAQSKGAH